MHGTGRVKRKFYWTKCWRIQKGLIFRFRHFHLLQCNMTGLLHIVQNLVKYVKLTNCSLWWNWFFVKGYKCSRFNKIKTSRQIQNIPFTSNFPGCIFVSSSTKCVPTINKALINMNSFWITTPIYLNDLQHSAAFPDKNWNIGTKWSWINVKDN